MAKRAIEGWIWQNERCGYPFGSSFYDFPGSDSGNLLLLKILGFVTEEYFKAVNLFILLSFSLAFVSAFIVQLSLGLNKYFALSSAILFAVLPFHFIRLAHLFYASYFVAPMYFHYAFQIFYADGAKCKQNIFRLSNILGFVLLMVLSSFGLYYALFGIIVIAASGLLASFKNLSINPLGLSMVAVFVITLGVFLNLSPAILNNIKNGNNSEVAVRNIGESEVYGFKLAQLVLPRIGHRIQILANITNEYIKDAPLVNENSTATLGLFGSIGLLISGCALAVNASGRSTDSRISLLALISLVLFLSGTIGGLGSLFAMTITSSIRGWNRLSPFLSFACLAIFFFFLQNYLSSLKNSKVLIPLAAFCILFAGLYDQTVPPDLTGNTSIKNKFESDRAFIELIETNLEPKSPIYQLPYMMFPESGKVNNLENYELCTGFLHSNTLRWSYAGMKGRQGDLFYRGLSNKAISEQLPFVKKLGFKGIYVDRRGYADNAVAVENELYTLLPGAQKIENINNTAFFIKLPQAETPDFNNLTPFEILAKIGWGVLKPGMRYNHGQTDCLTFQSWSGEEKEHRWSLGKKCSIEFTIDSSDDFQGELILEGNSFSKQKVDILLNNTLIKSCDMDGSTGITSVQFSKTLLKHGSNKLTFLIPGAQKPGNGDPREVGYAFVSIQIK